MKSHELKILPEYYWEVCKGSKTFEIRRNDRGFGVGDEIVLRCWSPEIGYHDTPLLTANIKYITSYEQKEDYVVFSFSMPQFWTNIAR